MEERNRRGTKTHLSLDLVAIVVENEEEGSDSSARSRRDATEEGRVSQGSKEKKREKPSEAAHRRIMDPIS